MSKQAIDQWYKIADHMNSCHYCIENSDPGCQTSQKLIAQWMASITDLKDDKEVLESLGII